jgi:hypothetical protein
VQILQHQQTLSAQHQQQQQHSQAYHSSRAPRAHSTRSDSTALSGGSDGGGMGSPLHGMLEAILCDTLEQRCEARVLRRTMSGWRHYVRGTLNSCRVIAPA